MQHAETTNELSASPSYPDLRRLIAGTPAQVTAVAEALVARCKRPSAQAAFVRAATRALADGNAKEQAFRCIETLLARGDAVAEDVYLAAGLSMSLHDAVSRDGKPSYALNLFRLIRRGTPSHLNAAMSVGLHWLDSALPVSLWAEEAEGSFRAVLGERPNHVDALYGLAMVLQARSAFEQAARTYLRVLELAPSHAAAWLRLRWPENWRCLSAAERAFVQERAPVGVDPAQLTHAATEDPALIAQTIARHGCAIVKSAIPASTASDVFTRYESVLRNLRTPGGPSAWRIQDVSDALDREALELVLRSRLRDCMEAYFELARPGVQFGRHFVRFVQWHEPADDAPARMHQDHTSCFTRFAQITCWVPLTRCGSGEAPAVQVFPVHFNEPVRVVEDYPSGVNTVPREFAVTELSALGLVPRFEPGDAVLFEPYMFHRTEVAPSAERFRVSFDLRFKAGVQSYGFGTDGR